MTSKSRAGWQYTSFHCESCGPKELFEWTDKVVVAVPKEGGGHLYVLGEWDGYYGVMVDRADGYGQVTLYDEQFQDLFPTLMGNDGDHGEKNHSFDVRYISQGIYCYTPDQACLPAPAASTPSSTGSSTPIAASPNSDGTGNRQLSIKRALDLSEIDSNFMTAPPQCTYDGRLHFPRQRNRFPSSACRQSVLDWAQDREEYLRSQQQQYGTPAKKQRKATDEDEGELHPQEKLVQQYYHQQNAKKRRASIPASSSNNNSTDHQAIASSSLSDMSTTSPTMSEALQFDAGSAGDTATPTDTPDSSTHEPISVGGTTFSPYNSHHRVSSDGLLADTPLDDRGNRHSMGSFQGRPRGRKHAFESPLYSSGSRPIGRSSLFGNHYDSDDDNNHGMSVVNRRGKQFAINNHTYNKINTTPRPTPPASPSNLPADFNPENSAVI